MLILYLFIFIKHNKTTLVEHCAEQYSLERLKKLTNCKNKNKQIII